MILHLIKGTSEEQIQQIAEKIPAIVLRLKDQTILLTSSKIKETPKEWAPFVEAAFPMDSDIQLASRSYRSETREIDLGDGLVIGGSHNRTLMITGPCSVESRQQINECAAFVSGLGLRMLRGGCYKPRTSPYSFQGLGLEGLKLLAEMRDQYGLKIVTEVRDATHVEEVIEHTDIIQIGAKAMYDQGVLRRCGKARKPVLLKRGFGTKLQEFVQAAEFILSAGNESVLLCERGIRTFEDKTRFTLDLCGVAYLKEYTNLPIVLDTSHAMGYRYGIADLTRACVAMGVDGLLIESHPNPSIALSDAAQQLQLEDFRSMYETLLPVAASVNRTII